MGRTIEVKEGQTVVESEDLLRLRRLAQLLDSSIPLPGGYRAGLESLIGLIPGFGDAVGAALSAWIILQAAKLGAPRSTLAHMVWNVLVETVIGAIPLVGDLFDIGYKANLRNLALLEARLYGTPYQSPSDSGAVRLALGILVVLLLLAVLALWLFIKLIQVLL